MTEDEAKTKKCFASRASGLGEDIPCIAASCMAWRVRHQWLDNAQQEPGWVSYAPYAFQPGPAQERDDGFCGLAGAPP